VQEDLEVSWSREGRFLDPYFALPNGVSEPVVKGLEFCCSGLLVDSEGIMGIEGEGAAIEAGDIEASNPKVNSPDTQ
jgi:hypothetical protein